MAHTASELRIQQLRIRTWMHVVFCVLYGSAALFCAIKHILVGVVFLVAFAGVSGMVVRKSTQELSRLRDDGQFPLGGNTNRNMTLGQLQSRVHALRIRVWSGIGVAAICILGACFMLVRQNVMAALALITLTGMGALIINRSALELLRLRDNNPDDDN